MKRATAYNGLIVADTTEVESVLLEQFDDLDLGNSEALELNSAGFVAISSNESLQIDLINASDAIRVSTSGGLYDIGTGTYFIANKCDTGGWGQISPALVTRKTLSNAVSLDIATQCGCRRTNQS